MGRFLSTTFLPTRWGSQFINARFGGAAVGGDTSVTTGSVTFSWTNGRTAGTDESGRAYIVVPTGSETINQPTPAQTTVVADVVGGVMYNPQRTGDSTREHGFDERNPKYNGTLNVTGTQAMSAGDRLIKSVPNTADYDDTRDAFSEEYGILYAVSSAPASGAMLGPAVTYLGHSYPDSYSIDWTALVNRCQNRAVANGMNFPTYAKMIAALNEQMCMYPFNSSDSTSNGYEPLITHDMLGLSQHQYGGDLAEMIDVAFIGLQYNVWSTAEKTAIIKRLVRHGIDMFPIFDANKASAVDGVQARGSHSMFHQGCLILALEACGRSSDIADIFTYEATGCWDQAFKVTNALITSDFSSHTSDTLPQFYRQMTLGAQPGGTTLRLPNSSRIFAVNTTPGQVAIPPGTRVMRGGSHVATITAEVDFGVGASGTFDVTIDAQPSPAFATSDVVSLEAPVNTVYDGAYDWQQNGGYVQSGQNKELFSPSAANNYRSSFRVGNIVGLGAMGLYHPVMDAVRGYFERTRGTEPASNNNYFDAFGDWQGGAAGHDISDILYDDAEVKALLYATSDFESADPSALSIYQIDAPTVAVAGTDVLAAADFTAASGGVALKVSGVATGGENTWVEIRAIKASDSTVVLDWYPRAQISAGGTWAWSGVIPETTDSRLLFEARSLGTPAVIHQPTEEIGVGYVSDVTAPTLSSPTDAANGATASTASVSTDEGNGTLYWVVTTSATAPSAAQVKLGQDNSSVAATDSGSQSVSGTGVQTISPAPSGLTSSTSYTTHFMHEDAAGNQSTVSSASGFTTASDGATFLSHLKKLDTSGAAANRFATSYYAFNDAGSIHDGANSDPGGTAPASGDVFCYGIAFIGGNTGSDDPSTSTPNFEINDSSSVALQAGHVAATLARSTPGGVPVLTQMTGFTHGATAAREAYSASTNGGSAHISMRSHGVWKIPSTHTETGAVGGSAAFSDSVTLDLSGVPGDWVICAVAMHNTTSTPIVWTGLTKDDDHNGTFNSTTRAMSFASGTGSGASVTITATNAVFVSVLAFPPV